MHYPFKESYKQPSYKTAILSYFFLHLIFSSYLSIYLSLCTAYNGTFHSQIEQQCQQHPYMGWWCLDPLHCPSSILSAMPLELSPCLWSPLSRFHSCSVANHHTLLCLILPAYTHTSEKHSFTEHAQFISTGCLKDFCVWVFFFFLVVPLLFSLFLFHEDPCRLMPSLKDTL